MTKEKSITINSINNNVSISTKSSKTLIKAYKHEDFPTLPTKPKKHTFSIPTTDLLGGLSSVWFSASTSSIKPELSSVFIYPQDKHIYFVSTDSFRLSEKKVVTEQNITFDPILIPISNVTEILKILEYIGNKEIDVFIENNQISLKSDNIYITSRLIDGSFPDYKQIIPKKHTTEIVVLKEDINSIFRKITVFSNKYNQVKFHISKEKKRFLIKAENDSVGETEDALQATVTGEGVEINFNYKYISDVLNILQSDSLSLLFGGLGKPMVIRGISDKSYLYLVMPMNR